MPNETKMLCCYLSNLFFSILIKMEIPSGSVLAAIILVIATRWIWQAVNWLWLKPKKIEKILRQQGLQGNNYRFFYGDFKEIKAMVNQTKSAPIDFSQNICSRLNPFLLQHINNYGKNCFMWFGPSARVNIMNPELVKEVFIKMNEFQKVKINPQGRMLAPGVAVHEGDQWVKHRRILNPAFHQEKLKMMLPLFYESCNEMVEKWEKLISRKESVELDVWPYLQNLSCDVISRAAFGSNYEEGKIIFDLLKELTTLIMPIFQSVYIPGWRFIPTKTNNRIKQIDKEIEASLMSIIGKREKAMKESDVTNDDLLGLLIESNLKEINEGEKRAGLSIKEVMDECRLFYFAGQETTSVLLVWTMILLSKFPHWQQQARQEVMQVFGIETPHFDGLSRLKVVTMILYEVLRLYPPAAGTARVVNEEIKLGNLILPAGVQVSVPLVLIHQDPQFWGNDASQFNPQRFSEGISKATNNQLCYLPFGWGPRICIGQNFALAEAKMALALILQRFSFDLSLSYSHAPTALVTVKPEHGAQLVLTKLEP
ncbi:cytochrome P450 72A397-like [Mercurialis annua]|uniref:cytochrome P450 72A397-like n=1 Tax=Mercurialis annua TaxID=3986 RepID=UPI00215E803E|nr:cytochrome P450 72A397-like [Mercurialis annua]